MSEAIPGVPPPPPPAGLRDAAAVVVYRRVAGAVELFWLKREAALSFGGGFYAFPGGKPDTSDASVPVEGSDGMDAILRVAAARELLEETGVLAAHGAERLSHERITELRRALLEKKASFAQILSENGLVLRREDYREAGRWITPEFMPRRFDARFFLVEVTDDVQADPLPGEAAEGAWIRPLDALRRWEAGTALLHPPTLHALRAMAAFTTPEETASKLAQPPPYCPGLIAQRIEFQRGIRVYPLETPTLPPAAHTNCYVLGNGELLIVDPGAATVRQCARLFALVAGLEAEGMKPKAVFLTHHHADHVGGARAVKERLGLELWCHEKTADRLDVRVERRFSDGEVLELAGQPPMRFQVLHTPGHARGHLCLVDEVSRAAIVGDMVAGVGTIVIDPPEGDMADYLAQLRRLKELPVGTVYPAHGPAIPDGPAKLAEYIQHRSWREQEVLKAIPSLGATLKEIVALAYTDVPLAVHPIAERSTEAILIKLAREGKVEERDGRYVPRS